MKKLIILLVMVLVTANMYAQNLTKKFVMGQLPTTADDFQKYQFDYRLECAQDVGYDYDVYVPGYSFDGVNVFPLERNAVPIKSIECRVAERGSTIFRLKTDFTSSGKVNNYLRRIGNDARYQFGNDSWFEKEWISVGLTPCVPNSFACWTSPTRNDRGLIVSVSVDLNYQYDSRDRVTEVNYHDNEFVYKYTYEGDSKRISTISVLKKNKEIASVRYTWNNNKISKLHCHIDSSSGFAGLYNEYVKSYQYDSHNNISVIEYREIDGNQWSRKIYEFNNKYNSNGQLISQNVVCRKTNDWDMKRGKPEETKTHTRSYIFDEKGNWIEMREDHSNGTQSVMIREIVYSNKKVGEVDLNNIYDEEEVETHATFGMTLLDAFRKNGIGYESYTWANLGGLIVNIRFVIDRNGKVYFYDEPHTNKENMDVAVSKMVIPYIKSLPWAPASIKGTFVNSITSISWKYNKTENSYSTEIIKDVVFTEKEKKQFEIFHRMMKEQEEAARGNLDDPITEEQSKQYREIWTQAMKYLDEANNAKYWYHYREPLKKADELFETLQFKRNSGQMYSPELVQKYRNQIRESISSNTRIKFETTVLEPSNYKESEKSNKTTSNNASGNAENEVKYLIWQLNENLKNGDTEAAKPIAESLYNILKSSNADKEKILEQEMLGHIVLTGYYDSIKDNAKLQLCNQKAIDIAQKILKIYPNNETAKSFINYMNNDNR